MYKRIKKAKLGRKSSHRKSLKHNLLRSLFDKNYVLTTSPRAKVLKQEASSLIEKALIKKEELFFRRDLQVMFGSDILVKKFVEYVGKDKVGVRIVKVGFRAGDNAETSRVSLIGMEKKKKIEKKDEEKEVVKKDRVEKKIVGRAQEKKVDTTAVVHRTERAKSRSGL